MHELALAQRICEVARAHVPAGRRLVSVAVEAGPLSGVVQEALEFGFEVVCKAAGLAGTRLDFVRLTAPGRCPACQAEFDVNEMWARCPACQHEPVTVTGGSEFRIKEIEVDDV